MMKMELSYLVMKEEFMAMINFLDQTESLGNGRCTTQHAHTK